MVLDADGKKNRDKKMHLHFGSKSLYDKYLVR